jgi:hypothetical protein
MPVEMPLSERASNAGSDAEVNNRKDRVSRSAFQGVRVVLISRKQSGGRAKLAPGKTPKVLHAVVIAGREVIGLALDVRKDNTAGGRRCGT